MVGRSLAFAAAMAFTLVNAVPAPYKTADGPACPGLPPAPPAAGEAPPPVVDTPAAPPAPVPQVPAPPAAGPGGDDHTWQPPTPPPAVAPTPAQPANPFRATHRVLAGFNGLRFEPENIVAEIGDLVEVHFNPKNHSFAQSSFDAPCVPINDDAVFSGFFPTAQGEAPEVFTMEVKDKTPFWFYCAQTTGAHCQMGMAGVVNQNFDGDKTLANYKIAAAKSGVSVAPPKPGNGGTIGKPPNGPGL